MNKGQLPKSSAAASSSAASPPPREQAAGQRLRRKSVTFADEPMPRAPAPAEAPQQRGIRKGFLDRPKPVLKKTSQPARASEEAPAREAAVDAAEQRRIAEGRDAAFSGTVVERVPEEKQEGLGVSSSAGGQDALGMQIGAGLLQPDAEPAAAQAPVKKVSRFRQQRAGT